jgi:DnaJ-class molecular chaperone
VSRDERTRELVRYLDAVWPDLDLFSYYQLLEVPADASPDAVRSAFYARAAALHPDRFPALEPPALKERLVTVYARIAEGYRVLSDARRRAAYDVGLAQGRMRWGAEREKKGPRNPEDAVAHPQAKRFLRLALQAQQAGDLRGAAMNVTFARTYEPASDFLRELEARLKGGGGP